MVVWRRTLVAAALLLWQGGGAFYGAVGIPIGRRVLGDQAAVQSVITRDVTGIVNWLGVAAVAVLLLDLPAADPSPGRRRLRAAVWLALALCQGALLVFHSQLQSAYDGGAIHIHDAAAFRVAHKGYLWASTVQFACALGFLGASVSSWRAADLGNGKIES